jgi:hypothetical protein
VLFEDIETSPFLDNVAYPWEVQMWGEEGATEPNDMKVTPITELESKGFVLRHINQDINVEFRMLISNSFVGTTDCIYFSDDPSKTYICRSDGAYWYIRETSGSLSVLYKAEVGTGSVYPQDGNWHSVDGDYTNVSASNWYALPTESRKTEVTYQKSETLTTGLYWTSVKPKVGKSYTEDALVEVTPYTGSIEIADMVFYAPLDSIDVKIGSALTNSGSVFFDENNGIKCARFNGSNCLLATDVVPTGSGQLTCCWWSKLDAQTNGAWVFLLGESGSYRESFFGRYYDYTGFDLSLSNYEVQSTGIIDHTAWSFITMVYTGAELSLYINGEKKVSEPYSGFTLSSGALSIGRADGSGPIGYMASVRIFTRALTGAEITSLYEEHSDKIQ